MQLQLLDSDYVLVNGRPIVRLFGKTESGESACAMVEGYQPYFYLHPNPELDIKDVQYELEKSGMIYEVVERFLPIGWSPKPAQVLKITGRDPSKIPEMRAWVSKFGTPYEADVLFKYRYMVDNGLRGMSWFDVSGKIVQTNTVKCKTIRADEIRPIELLNNAPLRYMALDIECAPTHGGLPDPEDEPIIMIGLSFWPAWKNKTSVVILSKKSNLADSIGCQNEEEMMRKFKDIIDDYDPDVITGYNITNFDMPYILKRLEMLNLPRDLGRSDKSAWARKLALTHAITVTGRVVVDPYDIIKRDPWVKLKRYDLRTVAKNLLNTEKHDMSGSAEITRLWKGSPEDLKRLVDYNRKDSELAMRLVIERGMLDKFFEIAKISGLVLQDALGGQSARHEFKLLQEFRKRKFIMPCKPEGNEIIKRKEEREASGLKGALVLEPETGLHSAGCTIVLDFTSLYPSIIKTFNVCPTTWIKEGTENPPEHLTSPFNTRFVLPSVREGVLPSIVHELISTRSVVRKQARTEPDIEKKRILNAKQLALKDMANSLYGYTGFAHGRIYVMDIANTITAYGRDIITTARKTIEENFPYKVIYADTDSTFIKTDIKDLEEAQAMGERISKFVTERLPGLELKFEKLFKTFLIETKKRYAALSMEKDKDGNWTSKMEMKGIETVRRDWCTLTTETMNHVLQVILKEGDIKKASKYVREIIADLAAGKVPIEKLTVVKGITKEIDAYDGIQPHVELAKKIIARDASKRNMVGERLEYVIIKGNAMLSKRAEDPQFVKDNGLEIDSHYYIDNQILPPLERIFEACGVTKTELIHGTKQMSLLAALNGQKPVLAPEKTVLKNYEAIVCRKCDWTFRRPTLTGMCPSCSGQLFFSSGGSIGKFIGAES